MSRRAEPGRRTLTGEDAAQVAWRPWKETEYDGIFRFILSLYSGKEEEELTATSSRTYFLLHSISLSRSPTTAPTSSTSSPLPSSSGRGRRGQRFFKTELFIGFVLFLLALGYLYEVVEFLVTIWELTLFAPL